MFEKKWTRLSSELKYSKHHEERQDNLKDICEKVKASAISSTSISSSTEIYK